MRALVVSIRGRTLETEVVPTDATQLNDIKPFSLLSRATGPRLISCGIGSK
jgi:hypothetical protein